jgi:hypothetical protein
MKDSAFIRQMTKQTTEDINKKILSHRPLKEIQETIEHGYFTLANAMEADFLLQLKRQREKFQKDIKLVGVRTRNSQKDLVRSPSMQY